METCKEEKIGAGKKIIPGSSARLGSTVIKNMNFGTQSQNLFYFKAFRDK
jgi:hypothetical protein